MNYFKQIFKKSTDKTSVHQNADRPYGSTDEEIKQFFSDCGQVSIKDTTITIQNYPFVPSIAYDRKTFTTSDIKSIDIESAPPTVQIGNELIFIGAEQKDKLKDFATQNNIPVIQKPPIWNWILEPFFDTEFTSEHESRLNNLLAQYCLTETEILEIRIKVKEQMMKYNFDTMLWNWTDFSAADVLFAMLPKYSDTDFKSFYENVMRIALLQGEQKSTSH
ncbi:MAG: hypothetical protein ABI237_18050 [Ginsengibacter sp.]